MVCYGTSLTAGSGWVKMLNKELKDWYVINSGKGGMNSNWGVDNFYKKVLRYKPKIVLMEFAINDAYIKDDFYKLVDIVDSITNIEILTLILRRRDIKVYLMAMNPPLDLFLSGRNPALDRPDYSDYYFAHQQIAKVLHIPFIDHTKEWRKLSTDDFLKYCPDGLHPNELGSKEITIPTILKQLSL